MKVRACFIVESVTRERWGGETVKMHAVSRGDKDKIPEAEKFHTATPSGSFEMKITNPALHGAFNPDEAYYLDITRAPED